MREIGRERERDRERERERQREREGGLVTGTPAPGHQHCAH